MSIGGDGDVRTRSALPCNGDDEFPGDRLHRAQEPEHGDADQAWSCAGTVGKRGEREQQGSDTLPRLPVVFAVPVHRHSPRSQRQYRAGRDGGDKIREIILTYGDNDRRLGPKAMVKPHDAQKAGEVGSFW
jgi:hypothetical protein